MKIEKRTVLLWGLTLLRIVIGWHFLYEGLWKLMQPNWSAVEYLRLSRWIGAPLFQWIVENPAVLKACDQMTMWGLVAIGLGLMTGVLARVAASAGVLLLLFFYIAHPPFLTVARTRRAWACLTFRWWKTPISRTTRSTRASRTGSVHGLAGRRDGRWLNWIRVKGKFVLPLGSYYVDRQSDLF